MADAIARAAGVPAVAVRRAAMLGGDLPTRPGARSTGGAVALAGVHLEVLRPDATHARGGTAGVGEALTATGWRGRMEARRGAHPGAP